MGWRKLADGLLVRTRNTFGETIVYTPQGGSSRVIKGVFQSAHQQFDPDAGAMVIVESPVLDLRLADLSVEPKADDAVQVGTRLFKVSKRLDDGNGGTKLFLRKA